MYNGWMNAVRDSCNERMCVEFITFCAVVTTALHACN